MSHNRNSRVLCVDDDPASLRSLIRLVDLVDGVEVDAATSARQARQRTASTSYAVVITDLRMPGESGIDLLEHLARERPEIVPVLTTGHLELEIALEAINRGRVFAILRKPLSSEDVLLTVTSAIERHRLGRTLREKIRELEAANRRLRQSRDQIKRLCKVASTDAKTGVRSYGFFSERIEEEIARAERYACPLSLVLVDLDGFKAVNDRHGHMVGDRVLREVADLMSSAIRAIDILARFGGDEFALLLPGTDLRGTTSVCERLLARVRNSAFDPIGAGAITLSAGIAGLPTHPVRLGPDMVQLADQALYAAKQAGGDCLAIAHRGREPAEVAPHSP